MSRKSELEENRDIVIVSPKDNFVYGGTAKDFVYTLTNKSNEALYIYGFNVEGDYITIKSIPEKFKLNENGHFDFAILPNEELKVTIHVTVPQDYDKNHTIGLRPRFFGIVEKVLE